ncbi:hypothetical protein AN641_01855 [Candidatus Epulonipiscioides gigas]|nr:hypothetical protein AN641_01855 [Epulopiscium sp. SCG-C07WGA-EpuloA2]
MKLFKRLTGGLLGVFIFTACSLPAPNEAEATSSDTVATTTTAQEVPKEELKITVQVMKAINGSLSQSGEFIGTIMPSEVANIISPVMGTVENILVEDGDYVKKGQLLYTIDDDNIVAQLNSAVVALESSQKSKEQALFNANNAVTTQELSKQALLISKEQTLYNADNAIKNAQTALEQVKLNYQQALEQADTQINNANVQYEAALAAYQLQFGTADDISVMGTDKQIEDLQKKIDDAIDKIPDAQDVVKDRLEDVVDAEDAVEDAKEAVVDAEEIVTDLEEDLEEAKEDSKDAKELWNDTEDLSDDLIESWEYDMEYLMMIEWTEENHKQILAIQEKIASQEQMVTNLETAYEGSLDKIEAIEDSIEDALDRVEDAKDRVTDAEKAVIDAKDRVVDAQDAVADAQDVVSDLEEDLAYQREVIGLQNKDLKEEKIKSQALSVTQAENAVAQAEDAKRKTIETYELQIKQSQDALQSAIDAAEFTKRNLDSQLEQTETGLQASKNTVSITSGLSDVQIKNAQTSIDNAKQQLDQYTVESPISGIIENIDIIEDSITTSSAIAATVSDYHTMEVVFYVGTDLKNTIKLGQEVKFELEGKIYDAKVNEISDNADAQKKLFKITATLNPENRLENGATVRLTTGTFSQDQTVIIPYDCLVFSNGLAYVYKVENGRAIKVLVEIGLFTSEYVSILSGISAGDEVVTTWSEGLRDGVLLNIQNN